MNNRLNFSLHTYNSIAILIQKFLIACTSKHPSMHRHLALDILVWLLEMNLFYL